MISQTEEDVLDIQLLKAYSRVARSQAESTQTLSALLIDRLLSAANQERSSLAALLHDDALQLGYQAERLLRETLTHTDLSPQVGQSMAEALGLIQTLLRRLREIASEICPPPLEIVSLPQALQALLQSIEQRTGLHCFLWSAGLRGQGNSRQKALLYTIAREAINNVVHHAQASILEVTLKSASRELALSVRDNGCGFPLPAADDLLAGGHLGLLLLQERVKQLQGTWQLDSAPGRGTVLTVYVPLNQHAPGIYRVSNLLRSLKRNLKKR